MHGLHLDTKECSPRWKGGIWHMVSYMWHNLLFDKTQIVSSWSLPDSLALSMLWSATTMFLLLNVFHPMSVSFMELSKNLIKLVYRNTAYLGSCLYLICSYFSCRGSAAQREVLFTLNLLLPKKLRGRMILQVWRYSRIRRGKMLVRERCAGVKLRETKKRNSFCVYSPVTIGRV